VHITEPELTAASSVVAALAIVGGYLGVQSANRNAAKNLLTSINAENEQARLADKRLVYARCLAAFGEMLARAVYHREARIKGTKKEKAETDTRLFEAGNSRYVALAEVRLIAPANVVSFARALNSYLDTYVQETGARSTCLLPKREPGKEYSDLMGHLIEAMRADLAPAKAGEPGVAH
jgi:hypothetical protein